jgi:hypothetical protein
MRYFNGLEKEANGVAFWRRMIANRTEMAKEDLLQWVFERLGVA